eukprot:1869991-Pyramimonas_sp.AAC.1
MRCCRQGASETLADCLHIRTYPPMPHCLSPDVVLKWNRPVVPTAFEFGAALPYPAAQLEGMWCHATPRHNTPSA